MSAARNASVHLGKPSLRRRLEAYYVRVSPEQIENTSTWKATFEKIWEKFGGSVEGEQRLAAKLTKKYGTLVRLEIVADPAAEAAAANQTRQQQAAQSKNARSEEFYTISEHQHGSGIVSFTDPNFDPLAALSSPLEAVVAANPWMGQVSQRLDRVDQCRSLLPPCDPLYKAAVKRTVKPAAAAQQATPTRIKAPPAFVAIASFCKEGPLAVLYDVMMRRKRVRVVVRYANSIRGTLTGHLLAFDKHCNMLLKDVDEVYSPVFENVAGKSATEIEVDRRLRGYTGVARGENWTCRHRRLGQLMVRGDVVVLIYKPEQEQSCRPRTRKSPTQTIYRQQSARKDVPPNQQVGTPGSLILSAHKNSGPSVS